nr:hypothetical protein [Tanacetum cinerariifolium]
MWEAIERLKQGESLNIQDVKTNLFWEFDKFTSHDGETMESYYTRFYKLINKMIRNNLIVTTMQVNIQFLQQLQPKWSRFVTIVKQQHKLDDVLYHKPFNILKQYQNEVNELRAERLVRNVNPLALVATAQANQDPYYQSSREFGDFAKECRKPKRVKDSVYHKEKMLLCKQAEQCVPLQAEHYMAKIQEVPTADSGTDSEPVEQVQNDAGYNVFANDVQHSEQSESVSNTCLLETDDSNVIPDSPNMCEDAIQNDQNDVESHDEHKYKAFNDRTVEYDKLKCKLNEALGQLAQKDTIIKEGLKTKAYELSVVKEKHDGLMKQSLLTKSHYEGLVKQKTKEYEIQLTHANEIRRKMWRKCFVKSKPNIYKNVGFLPVSKSISKSQQAYNVMTNNINHFKEIVDNAWIKHSKDQFCAPTAQDMEILIQTCLMPLAIKTQNDSFKFVHELKQVMHVDLKYVESLEKEIDELESDKAEFSYMYDVILQECVSNDVKCSNLQSLSDLDALAELKYALAELQCMYLHKVKECDCLAQKLSKQTESVSKEVHNELLKRFAKVEKHSISLEIALQKCKEQNIAISELKKLIEKGKGKSVDTKFDKPYVVRQPNAQQIPKSSVLGVNHKPNVSRPQLKSDQSRDKVLPNNSQVKVKKTQLEVHPRIPSVSNKMKFVTACKDSLNSRTLNANAVCATCNKCLVDSNHFACVTKMLNDVNARTKKPNVVPISTGKPKRQAKKSIATHNKKKVASKSTNQKPQSYFRVLYENTGKA